MKPRIISDVNTEKKTICKPAHCILCKSDKYYIIIQLMCYFIIIL